MEASSIRLREFRVETHSRAHPDVVSPRVVLVPLKVCYDVWQDARGKMSGAYSYLGTLDARIDES